MPRSRRWPSPWRRMGFTVPRDGWRFEAVPDERYKFICRGQVVPDRAHRLSYEVFVEEVIDGDQPTVYAALLCSSDGFKVFQCRRFGLRLVPDWPLSDRRELLAEAGPPRRLRDDSDVRGDYTATAGLRLGRAVRGVRPDVCPVRPGPARAAPAGAALSLHLAHRGDRLPARHGHGWRHGRRGLRCLARCLVLRRERPPGHAVQRPDGGAAAALRLAGELSRFRHHRCRRSRLPQSRRRRCRADHGRDAGIGHAAQPGDPDPVFAGRPDDAGVLPGRVQLRRRAGARDEHLVRLLRCRRAGQPGWPADRRSGARAT